jgi:membrane-bound lytic murein transglycosylase B
MDIIQSKMRGKLIIVNRLILMGLVSVLSSSCFAEQHPGAEEFAQKAASEFQLDQQEVLELLGNAEFKQSIVDAMSRPAEGKPWHEYRPIFLTQKRIDEGVEFWRENKALIEAAAERFQVDEQIIVSIIGVETFYGRITGNYRVIDALATLSFYYPDTGNDRSEFFSRELMHFMVLGKEENMPIEELTGSYAGAMGLGQFIPSSYREYAVDLDGDGRRDLWSSMDDVIGSVANYLHRHGWEYGQPVVYPLNKDEEANLELVDKRDFKTKHTVEELANGGFTSDHELPPEQAVSLIRLEHEDADAFCMGFKNFYVITRYNRSPLYAMAVFELSEEIRKGMAE